MGSEGPGLRPVWLALTLCSLSLGAGNGYVGRQVCAGCHKSIAATQVHTNMARTWHDAAARDFPANYAESHVEGPPPTIAYAVKRAGDRLHFDVRMPGQPMVDYPLEAEVGGERHGVSFLLRVPTLEGLPVEPVRLVEARYFHYAQQNKLAFSLGFPEDKPTTYETALGRVLTPYLEKRCLTCHSAPGTHPTREAGVTCEICHGPGQPHLAALGAHAKNLAMWNPNKLPMADRMTPCVQCHSGSSIIEDPMPDDALISDQVTALKSSECWRQSGGDMTCINCHDPHQDAPRAVMEARAVKTCLRCHTAAIPNHAGLCPVNRTGGCVPCHMADETRGAFVIAEHWIRVQPGQDKPVKDVNPAWRTTVVPKHMYLARIEFDDRAKAEAVRKQLATGGSFLDAARANSTEGELDAGYLGDIDAGQFDPAWSAAVLKLEPGEISDVIEAHGKFVILQRMPRNFRVDAEAVFNKAMALRKEGKSQEAVNELMESLKIYPHLLRAMTWLGAMYGQGGNPTVSAQILTAAAQLYPKDAGVHYNLGLAYGSLNDAKEIDEYKRTLEIDPDYVLAYLNWGAALYAKGEYEEAIKIYREGIDVNPLFADLHYDLGLALQQQQKTAEGEAEIALAKKINPNVGSH